MKRIVLVRHAKAVPYGYEDDFNRDLTDRGERDAGKVSEHLEVLGIRPDLMVASPASRAWQTAVIFAGKLGYPVNEIVKVEPLYMEFTTGEFIDYVRGLPDEALTVFVFGHNPGISYFAERLARNFFGDMPTCSTVGIDFGVDSWKEVDGRSGTVAFHFIPKGL
jgi:phosphohistidine phosphatase